MNKLVERAAYVACGGLIGVAAVNLIGGRFSGTGDLATWATALGTTGTLLFAVLTGRDASKQAESASLQAQSLAQQATATEMQVKLLQDQQENALRQQARLIRITEPRGLDAVSMADFYVSNESADDVRALRVTSPYLRFMGHEQPNRWRCVGIWKSLYADDTRVFNQAPSESLHDKPAPITLDPRRALCVRVQFLDSKGTPYRVGAGDPSVSPTLDIEFIDAQGIRWSRWTGLEPRRSANAGIHRDPPPPIPTWDDSSTHHKRLS